MSWRMLWSVSLVAGAWLGLAPGAASPAVAQAPKDVTVVNPDTSPVPVRNVGEERREPFQAQINFTIPQGFVNGIGGVLVPEGKRFVVEYASLYVRDFSSRTVVRAWASEGLGGVRHYFVPTRTGLDSGGAVVTVAGQPVRFYVGPGIYANIWVEISSADEGSVNVEGSLSGYLVDAP